MLSIATLELFALKCRLLSRGLQLNPLLEAKFFKSKIKSGNPLVLYHHANTWAESGLDEQRID